MKRVFHIAVCAVALATACDDAGTRSGVGGGRPLVDLTEEEATAVCAWGIDLVGGEFTNWDCGDDIYGVADVESCVTSILELPDYCVGAVVWEMEACFEATVVDPCGRHGMCHGKPPC